MRELLLQRVGALMIFAAWMLLRDRRAQAEPRRGGRRHYDPQAA